MVQSSDFKRTILWTDDIVSKKLFLLYTDASLFGLGAVLLEVDRMTSQILSEEYIAAPASYFGLDMNNEDRAADLIQWLETAAVVFALQTWESELKGSLCRVFIDNTGTEGSVRKGYCRNAPMNALVEAVWKFAARSLIELWISRVQSDANIADYPSRFEFDRLQKVIPAVVARRPILGGDVQPE